MKYLHHLKKMFLYNVTNNSKRMSEVKLFRITFFKIFFSLYATGINIFSQNEYSKKH